MEKYQKERQCMKKKWTKIIVFLLVLTVFLTGCIDADMHITINRDGSGKYEIKVLTNPLILSQFNDFKNRLSSHGYQIRTLDEGDKQGWVAVKEVKSVIDDPPGKEFKDEANSAFRFFGNQTASLPKDDHPLAIHSFSPIKGLGKGFKVKNGLFTTTLVYNTHVDLTRLKQSDAYGLDQLIFNKMNLRLILTLPVKVDQSNATQVSPDGKTLIWKIRPGEDNPIYMSVKIPNPITWFILILMIVLLLIIALIVWMRRRKRNRNHQGPPTTGNLSAQNDSSQENEDSPDSFHWG
jgi:hypothetical protein